MQPSNSRQRLMVLVFAYAAWGLCAPLGFAYRWAHSSNADEVFIYKSGFFFMIALSGAVGLALYLSRNKHHYDAALVAERRP